MKKESLVKTTKPQREELGNPEVDQALELKVPSKVKDKNPKPK